MFQPNLLTAPTVRSVGDLTTYIQDLLEQDGELLQVWVTGEVSSVSHHRSGIFFTLQDPEAQATLRCVVWKSYRDHLAVEPESGEQVIVLGRIRLYPQRGQYQLMVWQVLLAGEGLRYLRYRQLRDRLTQEGLFDPERKRSLPLHPQTIAVVTSAQAAAWGDICRTLRSRYPGLKVLFSPTLVQGEQAPESIVTAIERVEADGRAEVLILARGGGASEDLVCFDDERVVRAIAACSIPIISGIGHQRDESLADLAADVYVHTPTAAAEQAIPQLADLRFQHQDRQARLRTSLREQLERQRAHLHDQNRQLQHLQLDRRLGQEQTHLAQLCRRLLLATQNRLSQQQQHHHLLRQTLESLDPRAVLQRGYALVQQPDGSVVRSIQHLHPRQTLTLRLADGFAKVQVINLDVFSPPSEPTP
ncbi:exodeoxyribonuclease VII large subunit [Synechococcales cyanobacterium C]|uniref:Exodeoxyribonuclease 7 large subunit n=1 Tax=Petrachloros mirabilis ULC683 TaxID=2781853 RepID=A0A8K2AGX3_9CYAN|nr:exodeoxyribonuclease VII large subunit [Petrachloros mirabilis]NCJ05644.1 exodeoxyribonuclease VII large subunit [Petrachloros mirabilis ULC683]